MNDRWKRVLQLHPLFPGLAALLFLEFAWFALLHPLVPSTVQGFLLEFAAGIGVFFSIWGASVAIGWLLVRKGHAIRYKVLALSVALSIGIGLFFLAYMFKATLSNNFHYCPELMRCILHSK